MPPSRSLPEKVLVRLLTGPLGFGIAGAIDVFAVLVMMLRYTIRTRPARR